MWVRKHWERSRKQICSGVVKKKILLFFIFWRETLLSGCKIVKLFSMRNLDRSYCWCICFERLCFALKSANSSWALSLSHAPIFNFSFFNVTLTILGALRNGRKRIAEALATSLIHDTRRRVGVVAACGSFLEWRTSQGHLNECVVVVVVVQYLHLSHLFLCMGKLLSW